MTYPYLRQNKDGTCDLMLWVQPGAARTHFDGIYDTRVKVRIKSPPIKGKANRELIRFLAKEFMVPTRKVKLVAGICLRRKTVRITGISAHKVIECLLCVQGE
jgi:hypothetical protein